MSALSPGVKNGFVGVISTWSGSSAASGAVQPTLNFVLLIDSPP
jgi:hypothetical protein